MKKQQYIGPVKPDVYYLEILTVEWERKKLVTICDTCLFIFSRNEQDSNWV